MFLGSIMSSETTAAAAGDVGKLRRDPMAMLPFCGYDMADVLRALARRWASARAPGFRASSTSTGSARTSPASSSGPGSARTAACWHGSSVAATTRPRPWTPRSAACPPPGRSTHEGLDMPAAELDALMEVDPDGVEAGDPADPRALRHLRRPSSGGPARAADGARSSGSSGRRPGSAAQPCRAREAAERRPGRLWLRRSGRRGRSRTPSRGALGPARSRQLNQTSLLTPVALAVPGHEAERRAQPPGLAGGRGREVLVAAARGPSELRDPDGRPAHRRGGASRVRIAAELALDARAAFSAYGWIATASK